MSARKALKYEEFQQTGTNTDVFSDFDGSFLPHPFTGQITRRKNVESVKMALRNLILTNKYERLRNPEFGSNIRRYLFENFTPGTEREIQEHIKYLVENYEPRVRLLDVKVTTDNDNGVLSIRILFATILTQENQEIELTLYRVR